MSRARTPSASACRAPRRGQTGVAVVVAVLIVALATSTVAAILWQQSLWVRQVENLTMRAQGDAIAHAATYWAAAILADDRREIDHLGEPWAQRIPPFAAETGELTGTIVDEQAKFNVNSLVRESGVSASDLVAFQRLLAQLGMPPTLADALVDWLDPDSAVTEPNGAEDAYYLALDPPYRAANRRVTDIAELVRIKGYSAEIVTRLAPHITALPRETPVNVNTASSTVLQAVIPALSSAEATLVLETRKATPFGSTGEFLRAIAKPPGAGVESAIDVKSRFFSAEIAVRMGRATVGYRAVYERGERGAPGLIAIAPLAY